MKPSLFFSAFEPLHEVPAHCDLCQFNPPVFSYEFEESEELAMRKGFCCLRCALELLHKADHTEGERWAEEKEALEVDEFDLPDVPASR
jgi:hypothetical protein